MSMKDDDIDSLKITDGNYKGDVNKFRNLLDSIENLDDKKKQLWLEIYDNAMTDRQNSFVMLNTMLEICGKSTSEHAVHGRTIVAYINNMSKANDQLIKLAELVRKAEEENEAIDPDEMLDALEAHRGNSGFKRY